VANGKIAGFAATLKKGAHVQVEGELRSREYEKGGVTQKIFEGRRRLDSQARSRDPAGRTAGGRRFSFVTGLGEAARLRAASLKSYVQLLSPSQQRCFHGSTLRAAAGPVKPADKSVMSPQDGYQCSL
jgi:single-stranded DNA-binding protein